MNIDMNYMGMKKQLNMIFGKCIRAKAAWKRLQNHLTAIIPRIPSKPVNWKSLFLGDKHDKKLPAV
jgi:hypothetical protein